MARRTNDPARLAVLGVLGVAAWNWAATQPAGSVARKTLDDLKRAFDQLKPGAGSATPPGGSTTTVGPNAPALVAQRQGEQQVANDTGVGLLIRTALIDFGGVPLVFDPTINGLRQDPGVGGTNVYQPGDGFVDTRDGRTWVWLWGTDFESEGQRVGLSHFNV